MALVTKSVMSSHVTSVGYDDETLELFVTFGTGKTARYNGVVPKDADGLMNSASVGAALRDTIKGRYSFEYVGREKTGCPPGGEDN